MNRLIILASLLLAASSCSNEPSAELDEPSVETSISFSAQLPSTVTRLGMNTDDDSGWTFSWENLDDMGNWHTGCTTLQQFINKAATGETASFSGSLGEGDNHRFIYPYEENAVFNETTYSIDISSQDGSLDKTFFITQEIYSREDLTNGTITTLPMEHVGGFMVVDMYLENYDEEYGYTLKEVEYVGIPTKANIDLEEDYDSDTICTVTETGSVTAVIEEVFEETTDEDGKTYLQAISRLNIIPFELAVGDELTVNLTVEIDNGLIKEEVTSSITFTNETGETQSFGRMTHGFTNLEADASSFVITITGCTISPWESGDETNTEINTEIIQ